MHYRNSAMHHNQLDFCCFRKCLVLCNEPILLASLDTHHHQLTKKFPTAGIKIFNLYNVPCHSSGTDMWQWKSCNPHLRVEFQTNEVKKIVLYLDHLTTVLPNNMSQKNQPLQALKDSLYRFLIR